MADIPKPLLLEIANYVREHGVTAAAAHFGMSDSTIRRRARNAGLHFQIGRPRNRDKARRNAEVFQLRQDGMTLGKIGEKYGVRAERIRQILEDLGGDPAKAVMSAVEPAPRQLA